MTSFRSPTASRSSGSPRTPWLAARRRLAPAWLLAVAMVLPLVTAAPAEAWSSSGPISQMTTSVTLGCTSVQHSDADLEGFSSSRVDNCGTMLGVTGGTLYSPQEVSPGGPHDDVITWQNVSGDGFGDGSAGDPVRSVTRVRNTNPDESTIEVEETNAYVAGDDAYLNTVEIHNNGVGPLRGVLYRRADCAEAIHNEDATTVSYAEAILEAGSDGSIQCTWPDTDFGDTTATPRVVMTPHTPGSTHLGDDFGDENLHEDLEAARAPYGDTCVCGEPLDFFPRIGLSWEVNIPAGGSATFQHSFAFAPRGEDIDVVSSLVGADTPDPGADAVTRLQGPSRFETAVEVSRELFPTDGGANAVALARADNFADALAGAPFANAQNASLLLTSTDGLHPATSAEMQRVLPDGGTVFVLGGTAAVSDVVVTEIEQLGFTVERISGPTRYATSVEIAKRTASTVREIWYADGNTYGNALAAGAAAAGRDDAVLLLLDDTRPTAEVLEFVAEIDAQPTEFVLGAIEEDSNDIAVQDNRTYDTGDAVGNAAALASDVQVFFPSDIDRVGLASSESFPDGLAGGVHAGSLGVPLLLTPSSALASETAQSLQDLSPLVEAYLYGGDAALSTAVADEVSDHLS